MSWKKDISLLFAGMNLYSAAIIGTSYLITEKAKENCISINYYREVCDTNKDGIADIAFQLFNGPGISPIAFAIPMSPKAEEIIRYSSRKKQSK